MARNELEAWRHARILPPEAMRAAGRRAGEGAALARIGAGADAA